MKSDTNKKGFALLVAILISAFVLSVSVSVALIASKELGISNTLRESTYAYYSSESGVECAKYWATKDEKFFAHIGDFNREEFRDFQEINCNGKTIDLKDSMSGGSGGNTIYNIIFSGNEGTESAVQIIREKDSDVRSLSILSKGYNLDVDSDSGSKVQRFKEINVVGPIGGDVKLDVMITMDVSGSMGGERSGQPKACTDSSDREIDCAIEAVTTIAEDLFNVNAKIGFNSFSEGMRCKDINEINNCNEKKEILDIGLTEDIEIFEDFFEDKSVFAGDNYRGTTGEGSSYNGPIAFALAELDGQYVVSWEDQAVASFPEFEDLLGSNDRDRKPDSEYKDVYILIGDFFAGDYHDSDWKIKFAPEEDDRPNIAARRAVNYLEAMYDGGEGALIYLIVIGDVKPGPNYDRQTRLRKDFFDRLNDRLGTDGYTRFDSEWENLKEVLTKDVLGSLGSYIVTPIQDK